MFKWFYEKIFGTKNDKIIQQYQKIVEQINSLEKDYESWTEEQIKQQTITWQNTKDLNLDNILIPAFALVREAAKRTLKQRHYDVQLMGGIALHNGHIAEMQTGEGKTLVATLAAYLNALVGKVHIVTVNDYLAKRDAQWMGVVYALLGLTTGYVVPGMDNEAKSQAYSCDIVYATNSELGFDYLRNNMCTKLEDMIQKSLDYVIIDEVDSILIDEARTPLVISGPTAQISQLYIKVDAIIKTLKEQNNFYEHDEKRKSVHLTDAGVEHVEKLLYQKKLIESNSGLYDIKNVQILHLINQALKANIAFRKDHDYLVKDNQIIIIDEFTGRIMSKSRYSDGLHQALEAKEGVKIEAENQILNSISFQNFFRLYNKLSGMTGTASTEADEFKEIYDLEVVTIPTNVPSIRQDLDDLVYCNTSVKNQAIIKQINECYKKQQPVLVGTVSVEKSEELSKLLKQHKIRHNILNAKNHQKEAAIINQAGRLGAVTIATNMAGRGTDIQLGGVAEANHTEEDVKREAEQVKKLGGLYVIGTEKNESRRIDNQLRGRAGRQGSAGITQFFVSLDDNLMRVFGGEKINNIMQTLGLSDNEVISHKWITAALESAQKKIESYNYEIRKNLIQYDNIVNMQRQYIYELRNQVMQHDNIEDFIKQAITETLINLEQNEYQLAEYQLVSATYLEKLEQDLINLYSFKKEELNFLKKQFLNQDSLNLTQALQSLIYKKLSNFISNKPKLENELLFKEIILSIIDQEWRQHLVNLNFIRKASSLRVYANKNPLNEYRIEAFDLFSELNKKINKLVMYYTMNLINGRFILENKEQEKFSSQKRNELCKCNSGIKYKYCHGKI